MFNDAPYSWMPEGTMKQRVRGLRDEMPPSEIRVYCAKTGKFLRIEKPQRMKRDFNKDLGIETL